MLDPNKRKIWTGFYLNGSYVNCYLQDGKHYTAKGLPIEVNPVPVESPTPAPTTEAEEHTCACGKLFDSARKLNAHKIHCKVAKGG